MEYGLDTIELTWHNLNDAYKSMTGQTFISEDHVNLNHFIIPLDADLNGYKLILNWKVTVEDTYADALVLQATARQEMYFIPEGNKDFDTLQEALAESQQTFTGEIRKILIETPLKDIVYCRLSR